jgi:hypothetical protein
LTNARIGRSSHICHFKCLMFCFSISLIFFQHLIKVKQKLSRGEKNLRKQLGQVKGKKNDWGFEVNWQ